MPRLGSRVRVPSSAPHITEPACPALSSISAEVAQLVEHNLAKVGVAGSSPVFRSKQDKEIGQVPISFFFPITLNLAARKLKEQTKRHIVGADLKRQNLTTSWL